MTAPLPQGLLNVTSTTVKPSSTLSPADVLFERHQVLHNFWKVHEAKSRATRDPSDARCRDLFWRVWGNPRLAQGLSANTLTRLFIRCQQEDELLPFELDMRRLRLPSTSLQIDWQTLPHRNRSDPSPSLSSDSSSTTSLGNSGRPLQGTYNTGTSTGTSSQDTTSSKGHVRASSQTVTSRPAALTRSSSGILKRTSFVAGGARTRIRPQLGRKKSSQSGPVPEPPRSPQATKSPRRSSVDETASKTKNPSAKVSQPNPTRPASNISAFELPSVSSWQSVDSNADPRTISSHGASANQDTSAALVDKSFRERFAETQNRMRSSSNLSSMNRGVRKTGSVVRFADEVDLPEEFRKGKEKEQLAPHAEDEQSSFSSRHRGSIGSIAAISDDGSEEEGMQLLPRTKSQLSLMIAEMKRKQSEGSLEMASPEALYPKQPQQIKANAGTRKEEEEKLLAMGRKDGVTRAGGVQLPEPQRLKKTGKFEIDDTGYESPEEPLY